MEQIKFSYDMSIGKVTIVEEDGAITYLNFGEVESGEERETPLINKTYEQLLEYFAGNRKTFDVLLAPKGTEFQQKVWQALQAIPYGETRSYKQVAEQIGNPKASRAIGMANNKNPIFIVIPCHRVIGANGSLVGFGGGLKLKQQLLTLEKKLASG